MMNYILGEMNFPIKIIGRAQANLSRIARTRQKYSGNELKYFNLREITQNSARQN